MAKKCALRDNKIIWLKSRYPVFPKIKRYILQIRLKDYSILLFQSIFCYSLKNFEARVIRITNWTKFFLLRKAINCELTFLKSLPFPNQICWRLVFRIFLKFFIFLILSKFEYNLSCLNNHHTSNILSFYIFKTDFFAHAFHHQR